MTDLWGPEPPLVTENTPVLRVQVKHQPEDGAEVLEPPWMGNHDNRLPVPGVSARGTLQTVSSGMVTCVTCKMQLQVFGEMIEVQQ